MYLTYSGGIHSFIVVNKAPDSMMAFNLSLYCSNWMEKALSAAPV